MISIKNKIYYLVIRLNKYWVAFGVFVFVTFLIGDSTIFKRISYKRKFFYLKREIEFNKKQKEKKLRILKILRSNDENLEKMAREQYLMTKQNEELFIIKQK